MDRIGVRAFSSKTAAGGYGKEPARDLKVLPSSGASESWCTVTFDDERSNGWTSPASEMLTTAGSRRSPLRTPTERYGSRVTGWTAIPFITRLFAVTPSAAPIWASIDSKRKGSSEAGAWPRSVSKAKTAPSLLSPKKSTPSGLKVRAPADCGMTWLIAFKSINAGRPE
jgi:hypothetical protein